MDINEIAKVNAEYISRMGDILEDGIIDMKTFQKEKIKILWILKEANGNNDSGWSIKDNFYSNLKSYRYWKCTFKKLVQVIYGIQNNIYNYNEIPCVDQITEITKRIAIINVKKIGGETRARLRKIEEYYNKSKDLFYRQIEAIDPDVIIVSCNLGEIFNTLKGEIVIGLGRTKHSIKGNKLIVYAKHPGCTTSAETYFNEIINCYYDYYKTVICS